MGQCFLAYVGQMLLPHLKADDIVIMDNLSSHKSKQVHDLIKQKGAILMFSPSYSPDLNPIKKAFFKIKHWMRMAQTKTVEETWKTVGKIIDQFTPQEFLNFCLNAQYNSI